MTTRSARLASITSSPRHTKSTRLVDATTGVTPPATSSPTWKRASTRTTTPTAPSSTALQRTCAEPRQRVVENDEPCLTDFANMLCFRLQAERNCCGRVQVDRTSCCRVDGRSNTVSAIPRSRVLGRKLLFLSEAHPFAVIGMWNKAKPSRFIAITTSTRSRKTLPTCTPTTPTL